MLDRGVSWSGIATAWRGLRLRAAAAVAAVALLAVPAGAGAEIVNPAPVNPATVTPHVVPGPAGPSAPAPTSDSARGPSAAPPPRSTPAAPTSTPHPGGSARPPLGAPSDGDDAVVRETDFPGAGIVGGDNDAPFPEGLPALRTTGCDLDCTQEWYDYIDQRLDAVWVKSLSDPRLRVAAASLLSMKTEAERRVEAQGGIPGEESPRPIASPTQSAPSRGSSGTQSAPSSKSPTKAAEDSKKDDGPPVGWALGEFDGTPIADALGLITGVDVATAVQEAVFGSSGSTACNQKTPEEKATAAACPK